MIINLHNFFLANVGIFTQRYVLDSTWSVT